MATRKAPRKEATDTTPRTTGTETVGHARPGMGPPLAPAREAPAPVSTAVVDAGIVRPTETGATVISPNAGVESAGASLVAIVVRAGDGRMVATEVGVAVAGVAGVDVDVPLGRLVGLLVGVVVGVDVGVAVATLVAVEVGVAVGVRVGVSVGVDVEVGVGESPGVADTGLPS